ncbi:MAG: XRE family transcriptional regulator [Dysgonamonadaceae bacterium]|jgi:transcriptional regulator with XRE-family HTH domain|nr:XRE family transcriptional regulator [Dysgonamonadaceae bacterium]
MNNNKLIGNRIKSFRESKQITINEMVERSGLGIDQISQIEENAGLPSLASLIKISRVLGVRLGTFLDDNDELGPVISRKQSHSNPVFSSNNDMGHKKHMSYFPLSAAKSDRHMEPFIIHIDPTEDGADFIVSSHEGEEFIFCMEGIVEITYGKNQYLLEEGDSIYYDSIVPHHVHAAGKDGSKILAVIYTPF